MLGGISQALAPKPKNSGSANEKQSFMFSNQQNVTTMGGPVPVLLGGPFMCGSTVVSAAETVEQIADISSVSPKDPVLR
jgi:predicted phage tail protein